MSDQIVPLLSNLSDELKNNLHLNKTVVIDSKVIGQNNKEQLLPLSQRLSKTSDEAMVRKHLESVQSDKNSPENDELDDAMLEMWADDILSQHLESLFKG